MLSHLLCCVPQALRESRHYSAQQQSLDKQLRECVYNIRNKEDLIAALKRNDLQAKQLSQQYLVRKTLLFRLFRPGFWSCNPKTLCLGQLVKRSHVVLTHRLCSSQHALLLYHIKSGSFLIFKKLKHYALYCPRIELEGQVAIKELKFIAGLYCWPPVPTKAGRAVKEENCIICLLK